MERTSATAAAAGAIEHTRSRKKKDVQRDNFIIVAAQKTLFPSDLRESGSEQPDGEEDFNEEQIADQFDALGNLRRRPPIRIKGLPAPVLIAAKTGHLALDCPSRRPFVPSGISSKQPPTDPRKCPFCDGSHHLEQYAQMATAAQLLETMQGENAHINDVRNHSVAPSAVVSSTTNVQQSLREQFKSQPSKMLAFDGNQSLLNVLQSSRDESLEVSSIPPNCPVE